MEVRYKNGKIREICTVSKVAQRKYGSGMWIKIQQRIKQLTGAQSVDFLVQRHTGRCHHLTGDRAGQYAMDLEQPYRLIFIKVGNEIQIVEVQEITDYH